MAGTTLGVWEENDGRRVKLNAEYLLTGPNEVTVDLAGAPTR
jgi:hypothetical protein